MPSDSPILFVTICSLNKREGGGLHYAGNETVASRLSDPCRRALLETRANVLRWLNDTDELWEGTRLGDLEFNGGLVPGPDFCGKAPGRYLAAIERYDGRLYQALDVEGRLKALESRHHLLIISGLYGLVTPAEPIQLYSCPVGRLTTYESWTRGNILTRVLLDYMQRQRITRVFDLTAVHIYRELIRWQDVRPVATNGVLHCFGSMVAGDDLLTPFGRLLGEQLLDAPAEELLALQPGEERLVGAQRVQFLADPRARQGDALEELKRIQEAEQEVPDLYAPSPEPPKPIASLAPGKKHGAAEGGPWWLIATTSRFRKDLNSVDVQAHGEVLAAIMAIARAPRTPHGDTVKPLTGELKGKWRYRLGDHRLIYQPDEQARTVVLLLIGPRCSIYGD